MHWTCILFIISETTTTVTTPYSTHMESTTAVSSYSSFMTTQEEETHYKSETTTQGKHSSCRNMQQHEYIYTYQRISSKYVPLMLYF